MGRHSPCTHPSHRWLDSVAVRVAGVGARSLETRARIRAATLADISELLRLNHKWNRTNLEAEARQGGYLSVTFTAAEMEFMVARGEVAVVEQEQGLKGYYLVNTNPASPRVAINERIMTALKQRGVLKVGARVAVGTQAVLEDELRGKGYYRELFLRFVEQLGLRYDLLFSTVSKCNPKIKAHEQLGWKIVGEDEQTYWVIWQIAQCK